MFEKVNPSHPDKQADCIGGALVDMAYAKEDNPRIAVEILVGHGKCYIIAETSVHLEEEAVFKAVRRITGISDIEIEYVERPQNSLLAKNQEGKIRCGDNGIFKGVPVTAEQKRLTRIAHNLYEKYPHDGKYILDGDKLVICQSNARTEDLKKMYPNAVINPLGVWIESADIDTGAVSRKLGSDMGDSVTGGGLHGKDLSKADVSVSIYAWLKAQETKKKVEISVAIGDEVVDGRPYEEIVQIAKGYINSLGGFEEFAKWGLIR